MPRSLMTGVLAGAAALAVAMGVGRFAYTPILPAMQAATGLGDDGAGLVASLNLLGYLVGALACGALPGGAERGLVFRASLVLSLATTGAMALTAARTDWALLRFLAGVASAGIFVSASSMVIDALAARGRPRLAGVHFGGVGAGIVLSGAVVALLPEAAGWRGAWGVLATLCVGLAVPCWFLVRPDPATSSPPMAAGTATATPPPPPRQRRRLALLAAAYTLEGAGYIVSGTFLVSILARQPAAGLSGSVAWIAVGLAAIPSGLVWSAVAARVGPFTALTAAHGVQALGIVLPVLVPGPAGALAGAVLFGGTFIGIVGLTLTIAGTLAGGRSGKTTALFTAAYGVGQIVGPAAAGLAAQATGGFSLALTGAAAVVALGGGLVALAARPRPPTAQERPASQPEAATGRVPSVSDAPALKPDSGRSR